LFATPSAFAERKPEWAKLVSLAGVPNLHKVTDNIYRGAQPTREGLKNLESLGIRTIINLRSLHGDDVGGTSLRELRIPMQAWDPEIDEVVRVMRLLTNESGGPYLIHCQQGADRTGMIIAVYRMAVQGWRRDAAIEEMTEGGYGFHTVWKEIPKFLRRVDIEEITARLQRSK
jgi:protein tyrosine/serine phosphatase